MMRVSENDGMEAVKLFDKRKAPLDWEYDGEGTLSTLVLESLDQPSEWTWEKA